MPNTKEAFIRGFTKAAAELLAKQADINWDALGSKGRDLMSGAGNWMHGHGMGGLSKYIADNPEMSGALGGGALGAGAGALMGGGKGALMGGLAGAGLGAGAGYGGRQLSEHFAPRVPGTLGQRAMSLLKGQFGAMTPDSIFSPKSLQALRTLVDGSVQNPHYQPKADIFN